MVRWVLIAAALLAPLPAVAQSSDGCTKGERGGAALSGSGADCNTFANHVDPSRAATRPAGYHGRHHRYRHHHLYRPAAYTVPASQSLKV